MTLLREGDAGLGSFCPPFRVTQGAGKKTEALAEPGVTRPRQTKRKRGGGTPKTSKQNDDTEN